VFENRLIRQSISKRQSDSLANQAICIAGQSASFQLAIINNEMSQSMNVNSAQNNVISRVYHQLAQMHKPAQQQGRHSNDRLIFRHGQGEN
jgi:ABC-type branched-subunit amino acid transport system ATPase component